MRLAAADAVSRQGRAHGNKKAISYAAKEFSYFSACAVGNKAGTSAASIRDPKGISMADPVYFLDTPPESEVQDGIVMMTLRSGSRVERRAVARADYFDWLMLEHAKMRRWFADRGTVHRLPHRRDHR